jgi:23S rRNA (guanosine2251-2'-O)-methyltransferase
MTVIAGLRAIEETIQSGRKDVILYVSSNSKRLTNIIALARKNGIEAIHVSEREITAKAEGQSHRGAIVELPPSRKTGGLREYIQNLRSEKALVVMLDGITDPHNFGAIIRSADQFNADCVIIAERRAAPVTTVVVTASAGASNYVRILQVSNLTRALNDLKEAGFWIFGADMTGRDVHECSFKGRAVLVMGSEGKGLSQLIKKTCDELTRIPTAGHVDSLNVSVAAGIFLYEIRKQQAAASS